MWQRHRGRERFKVKINVYTFLCTLHALTTESGIYKVIWKVVATIPLVLRCFRRVWRYKRGNQNPYIEEQKTQWSQEKVQKDQQRSTKHAHKNKDRVTRTPLKTGVELRCSGRVGSSCFTSGTRRVNLVTDPVISHEWGKDQKVFMKSGTYPWSLIMVVTVQLSKRLLQLNEEEPLVQLFLT